ncbi:MAG: SDR family oxidoreductase [Caldilineaceae bacterium]|nr:SDR family oxidoreductase [Caldilineaceae bacterium]
MLSEKICLITGATSGIGREAAQVLAQQGMKVVIVGRNEQKTAATVKAIQEQSGNANVTYLLADFADQSSTRKLAAEFLVRYDRLDVLINNAGAFYATRQADAAGNELTLAVNHLGYFLLTNLLLERLRASTPARIVNVASDAHQWGKLDFTDIPMERGYGGMKAYARSKLANILFTFELARRLEGTGVTVNTLHPGFVATNFGANNLGVAGPLLKWLINRFAISAAEGAKTMIYLATDPTVATETGKYFVKSKAIQAAPAAYDQAVAQRLWAVSNALTGLSSALE